MAGAEGEVLALVVAGRWILLDLPGLRRSVRGEAEDVLARPFDGHRGEAAETVLPIFAREGECRRLPSHRMHEMQQGDAR